MKAKTNSRLLPSLLSGVLILSGIMVMGNVAKASEEEKELDLQAGAATVVEADIFSDEESIEELVQKQTEELAKAEEERKARESIVMANVTNSVNVRATNDENSDKVGLMYKDCGGTIIERSDGWTKLQSGELIGWVKDEFLLFGEEAEAYAKEVGFTVATVETEALRVRTEPSEDAGVRGLLEIHSEHDVISQDEDWVEIKYHGKSGYIAKKYVSIQFYVDEGETIEEIQEREALAAMEKAKLTAAQPAITLTEEEIYLLGAIIQCEAGNQNYEGKLAVGAVVCNRVRSSKFPNTVTEVVYAPGQFSPASNGSLATRLEAGVSESCLKAAREAAGGATNVGTAHYFKRKGNKSGVIIGAHVFY